MGIGSRPTGRGLALAVVLVVCAATGTAQAQTASPSGTSPESELRAALAAGLDTANRRTLLKHRLAQSFVVVDLNRDGVQDVALADFLTDAVHVRLGDPSGSFGPPIILPAARGPRSIVAADFNRDGVVDLAVGEFLSGSVRVFGGRGDGQFDVASVVSLAPGVSALVGDDLDGDGRIDLAVANAMSGAIVLLRNNEDGKWSDSQIGRTRAPTLLLSRDVDGDATRDLVAVGVDGTDADVLAARGVGVFSDPYTAAATVAVSDVERRTAGRQTERDHPRLSKIAGDGQAVKAGSKPPESLAVEVLDLAGAASAGETVLFSQLSGGAQLADPAGQDPRALDARVTDDSGRASVQLILPALPEASLIAATLPVEQTVSFGVLTVVDYDEIIEAIGAALVEQVRDVRALAEHRRLLSSAVEHLRVGDAIAAVRDLAASADLLLADQTLHADDSDFGSAADLERRAINQILLMGVSTELAGNEPIMCSVPLRRTIESPTELDTYAFDGVAGEVVHITVANEGGTSFEPVWRLVPTVGGGPVPECAFFSSARRDCLITVTGSYAIQVGDFFSNGTGTYSVHLQRLTAGRRCGGSISCGAPVTRTLGVAGRAETHLHSFTGVANERVHVTLANQGGTNFDPIWRVVAPSGRGVAGCDFFTGAHRDCLLPVNGSYAVEILDFFFNGSGTYNVQFQRLTTGRRCGGLVPCDVPVKRTLSAAGRADTDVHSFTGVTNERVHITVANEGGTRFEPIWRLVAPNGTGVAGCDFFTGAHRDCVLPVSGSYAVEILDFFFNGTGTYSVHLQRLTAGRRCGGSIACDVPGTSTLGATGRADTNLHSFSAVANERVHLTLANQGGTSFEPIWRLVAPNGTGVAGCDSFTGAHRDCTLPVSGSYAVEVLDFFFNGTGTYSVNIQRLTDQWRCGGHIRCGVPIRRTLGATARADTDIWSFGGIAGGSVRVTLARIAGTNFEPQWRMVAPNGSGVPGCDSFTGVPRDCTLPVNGSYGVEILDFFLNGTGTYEVSVTGTGCRGLPDLTISSLTCAAATAPGAAITVNVRTANIGDAGAAASVTRLFLSSNVTLESTDLPLTPTVSVGPLSAGASFLAAPVVTIPSTTRPGRYFVIGQADTNHTVPEGNENNNTRSRALTIGPDLIVSSIVAPASALRGSLVSVAVTVANRGGSTAAASTMRLHVSNDGTVDGTDTFVNTAIGALSANGVVTVNVPIRIPPTTPIGTRFFIAAADAARIVMEANEANNTTIKTIVIQ